MYRFWELITHPPSAPPVVPFALHCRPSNPGSYFPVGPDVVVAAVRSLRGRLRPNSLPNSTSVSSSSPRCFEVGQQGGGRLVDRTAVASIRPLCRLLWWSQPGWQISTNRTPASLSGGPSGTGGRTLRPGRPSRRRRRVPFPRLLRDVEQLPAPSLHLERQFVRLDHAVHRVRGAGGAARSRFIAWIRSSCFRCRAGRSGPSGSAGSRCR
jgi:hypothetical protein